MNEKIEGLKSSLKETEQKSDVLQVRLMEAESEVAAKAGAVTSLEIQLQ